MALEFQHWQVIVENLADALIILDQNAKLMIANRKAKQLLRLSDSSSSVVDFYDLIDKAGHAKFTRILEQLSQVSNDKSDFLQLDSNAMFDQHENVPISLKISATDIPSDKKRYYVVTISEKNCAQGEVGSQKENLKMIFDHFNDAVFLTPLSENGVHENFIEVNKTACERLGYTKEELLTFNARTINPEANVSHARRSARILKKEKNTIFEAIHIAKDGEKIPVAVDATLFTDNGKDYILSVVKDLRNHKKLESKESLLGRLMDYSWNEIYVFNSEAMNIIMANQGAMENLGLNRKELLACKFTDLIVESGVERFLEFADSLLQGKSSQHVYETDMTRKDQSTYPAEIRLQLSTSEVPPVFLAHVQDITERRNTEQRLKYLATFDALTNLPNRSLFVDRLKMAMEGCKRSENLMAIFFLDLDGFKKVNDTYGHETGDQLIQEVGKCLSQCVRKSDTVARLGGDEFTLILTNIKEISGVHVVIDKILKTIRQPFNIKDKEIHTSTSIGVTMYPFNDQDDCYELIRQADSAMYNAKNAGKNVCRFYSYELSNQEIKQARLDAALRLALINNEFELFYQPKIDLETGDIIAAEALLRWKNAEFGNVSPAQFVPILEEKGMICEVGNWVLREACRQQRQLVDEGYNICIAINVSARQMEDEYFMNLLSSALADFDVKGNSIEMEITEGVLIDNNEEVMHVLREVKQKDIAISLDDFGTGYSSLGYLKRFPIDIVKIDRSFVMDLEENKDSLIIVNAIIGLAKNLGLRVTAEGIEDKWHADFLKARGCDEGQGYYFAKPMPAPVLLRFLETYKSDC